MRCTECHSGYYCCVTAVIFGFCLTFLLLRRLIQDRVRLPKASKGETLGLVRQLKVKWCVRDLCKYSSLTNKPPP